MLEAAQRIFSDGVATTLNPRRHCSAAGTWGFLKLGVYSEDVFWGEVTEADAPGSCQADLPASALAGSLSFAES